jgi:hypothetical protein
MSKEEQYGKRLEIINEICNTLKNDSSQPFFSVDWIIDNVMFSEEDKLKAKRTLVYEKRVRVIKKLLGDNE